MMKTKKYQINKGFITQKIDNKITIFSGEDSTLFTLNETAAYIFQGLKLGWNKQKIVNRLIDSYKITDKKANDDVDEFTKILLEKKILEESKS